MPTVQEFINSTLRLIRVLDSGETPTATESNDGLVALNQLISSWSAAGVPIYQESFDDIVMTGVTTYTLPSRPVKITSAYTDWQGVRFPVDIVPSQIWSQAKDATMTSKFAKQLYYNGGFPTATIQIWPNVFAGGSYIRLFSLKPLASFTSLGQTIDLPPGYEQALRFGLAAVLAPEYGSALPPEVTAGAAAAQQAVMAMNTNIIAQAPPAAAIQAAS